MRLFLALFFSALSLSLKQFPQMDNLTIIKLMISFQ